MSIGTWCKTNSNSMTLSKLDNLNSTVNELIGTVFELKNECLKKKEQLKKKEDEMDKTKRSEMSSSISWSVKRCCWVVHKTSKPLILQYWGDREKGNGQREPGKSFGHYLWQALAEWDKSKDIEITNSVGKQNKKVMHAVTVWFVSGKMKNEIFCRQKICREAVWCFHHRKPYEERLSVVHLLSKVKDDLHIDKVVI